MAGLNNVFGQFKQKKPRQPGWATLPGSNVRQDRPAKAPPAPSAPPAPKVTGTTAQAGPAAAGAAVAGPHALADDAQAAAARAQAIFDATQKRAALQAASTYDATDLAEAIRRLQTQRPNDENAAKNAANSQGLASSSTIVKNLGDIASQYVRSEGDARQAYGRREDERAAQLGDIGSQGVLSDAAIDAALLERQAQRDAAAAAANSLVTVPTGFNTGGAAAPGTSVTQPANQKQGKQPPEVLDKAIRDYLAAQAGPARNKKRAKTAKKFNTGGARAPA